MIIEQVTVTVTPTSVQDLLTASRPDLVEGNRIPESCRAITFKYSTTEVKVVYLSDDDTVTKVPILDNATEKLRATSIDDFSLKQAKLNVVSGTVAVDIIISEARV